MSKKHNSVAESKNGKKDRDKPKKISKKEYNKELEKLQIELVKLQRWIKHKGLKVVVLFEGRDAAGKGGTIKRISQTLNPRICKVVALGTPSDYAPRSLRIAKKPSGTFKDT